MNMMLKKALEAIRGYTDSVQKEIDLLDKERENLRREREAVSAAFRTKEEVIDDLDKILDIHREEYARRLKKKIYGHAREGEPPGAWANPLFRLNPGKTQIQLPSMGFFSLGREAPAAALVPDNSYSLYHECLTGLLADAIKPTIHNMMESMEWPENVISEKEREAKLKEIDSKIRALDEKISVLVKEAEEAGLSL